MLLGAEDKEHDTTREGLQVIMNEREMSEAKNERMSYNQKSFV